MARWKIVHGAESIQMDGGFGSWRVTLRRPRHDRDGNDLLWSVFVRPGQRVMWEPDPHDYGWIVATFEVPETPTQG
jgi:hypothetical protein